ncbi:MAG: SPFH domain-containing protein, partial [Pirellulaceae bacterium]|nr:SPFH domain-containing protein [Pirellulaceae bacterium]
DFAALAPAAVDPQAVVRQTAQSAGWQVQETGDKWDVVVPISSLRKQTVHVDFSAQDEEGNKVVSYTSTCGPATEKNAVALLKYNLKMVHGAFAIQGSQAGELVVIRANQLAGTLDPLEVTRVITAVAWQADKVEQQLMGGDSY